MKHGRLFYMAPTIWILSAALLIVSGITWFYEPTLAYGELAAALLLVAAAIVRMARQQRDIERYMRRVLRHITQGDEQALSLAPLPVAVVLDDGKILWHNALFEMNVLDNHPRIGESAQCILPNTEVKSLYMTSSLETDINNHHYRVFVSPLAVRGKEMFVLYYLDITTLHRTALEFEATRPIVLLIHIDNLDELVQRMRESERARLAGLVENALEDWIGQTTGILRKYDDDRFIAVVERRYLQRMIDSRFDILDRVRAIPLENQSQITLAIGVGEGEHFSQAEKSARQAIEMALGRGGDQAAVKTRNGFDFYGGLSKGVEKRTKVRTRVMASALQDLILASENVLVMGHRYSDLDSVGSGATMACVARSLGKPAHLVVSRKTTLAEELFVRFEKAGKGDIFVEPEAALSLIRPKTLLIITDTQSPYLIESPIVHERTKTVVIIDHHRKTVDHIDNAVLFYHESVASSACEMVSELVQYLDIPEISALEAEALLSGIMLDTRNFVLKAGVRTFEAAAFLKKQGADTVSVKKIFSGSMELYQKKADIMSTVTFYKHTAIAFASQSDDSAELRIACSQAADELLTLKDTVAAFALFVNGGNVNISARSYGEFNVQLVMEHLGGGGHLTMAGAQLKSVTMEQAINALHKAIDRYISENSTNTGGTTV